MLHFNLCGGHWNPMDIAAEHRAEETPVPLGGGGGGGVKKIIRDQRFGTGLGDSLIRSGYTCGGGWRTPAVIAPVFEMSMPRCQGTRLAAALYLANPKLRT